MNRKALLPLLFLPLFAAQAGPPAGANGGPPDAGTPPARTFYSDEIVVQAPEPTTAASAETVRDRDLQLRPHATPEDILCVVPGLVIAQHQGGGKADQLFLRGFDADHGTDVALFLNDVPINLPSHGHGQGFADLHFLIPETIDRMSVNKGPYFAEYGDFDTAGAVGLTARETFEHSSVSASYGRFDTYRILGIAAPEFEGTHPWLAAEVYGTNGPFNAAEGLQRYNVFAQDTTWLSDRAKLTVLATAYGSQWRASGQLPARAIDSGQLDRFGSLDPTEGGQTQRQMLTAALHWGGDHDEIDLKGYLVRYRVRLFSDFTYQLRDPLHFDEIEQNDSRGYSGFDARFRRRVFKSQRTSLEFILGAQARQDGILADLWHDQARARLPDCFGQGPNPCRSDAIEESDLAAFAELDWRWSSWLRVIAGARADLFEFDVSDQRAFPQALEGATGLAQRAIANPKLRIILKPKSNWDLYLDAGGGFHSNDARSATTNGGSGALPRAWGGEVGTRVHLWNNRLELAGALWALHLQSEQAFSADEGNTEAAGPTMRSGVDLEARWQLLPWLWADADLSLAHAVYTQDAGNGNAVALAPTRTGSAGVSVLHPSGWRGRVGLRYVGDRPANEDASLTAEGYALLDVSVARRFHDFEVGLVVENALNATWREAQFANDSQLRDPPYNETAPVEDLHFTPGAPLDARLTVAVFF